MPDTTSENSPKERLIATGIKLFAELNGHEVSNRRLAKEAKVNHAMINYHFGSRDGLCDAVFSRALEEWSAVILPILNRAEEALPKADSKDKIEEIARTLVDEVLKAVTGKESSSFLAVLLNEDLTTPQRHFDRLFDEVLAPFHTLAARLASKATGKDEDDIDCIVLGQVIVAQCMTFFRGRILLVRKLGTTTPDEEKTASIIRVVSSSVVAALGLSKAK